MTLNLVQPETQINHTERGFDHLRAPSETMDALWSFWREHQASMQEEAWPTGNTYTNHWGENPTFMLSLENGAFREGRAVKQKIWNSVKPLLEEWTGQRLRPSSLYGIRVYKEGAVLAPHVDRLPLVTSAIINVAQDLDEPWPIEVYDHLGRAHNVTMQPGDIVLYESHTVVHGRPAPLKGRFYANVFVHFMPVDAEGNDLHVGSSESMAAGRRPAKLSPPPVQREEPATPTDGTSKVHAAAARGDAEFIRRAIAKGLPVDEGDANEWRPLHEAARGGHVEVVDQLVHAGADLGAVTINGGTPLWWARKTHGPRHPVVAYFENLGAPEESDLSGQDEL